MLARDHQDGTIGKGFPKTSRSVQDHRMLDQFNAAL